MKEITQSRIDRLNRIFESYDMVAEGTDVYVCDIEYDYSRWSKSAVELYGLANEYIYHAGEMWENYVHPDDRELYRDSIKDIFKNGKGRHDLQYRAKDRSGRYCTCTCRGMVLCDDNGNPAYFVGMIRNHSVNGSIDNITGLRNQNGFISDINRYLKSHIPVTIVMYGSTNYTRINDLFGYHFGTRLLTHLIRYMLDHDRELGKLYRLDGARVAMISRTATIDDLKQNYEHYVERSRKSFKFEGEDVIVNINAGAVSVDSFDIDADTVLSCLVHAFQESKYKFQGRFCVFDPTSGRSGIRELEKINIIRKSVAQSCRNFVIYYQPIVDAVTERILGAEALVRWVDEEGNVIMPNDFIPVLENDALFPEFGEWILRHSMEQCLPILKKMPDFVLNVNLSYAQIQQVNFINTVKRALQEIGFPSKSLCLEITERCRLLNHDLLKDTTCKLSEEGIKIALDDFGTGFASLELLQKMHIDVIKIDRQFIKDVVYDDKQFLLIILIKKLAEVYGARVCAEGVETADMRDILNKCDVDKLQGYLYSKPLPFEKFLEKFIDI